MRHHPRFVALLLCVAAAATPTDPAPPKRPSPDE